MPRQVSRFAASGHAVILHLQHARLGPLAVLAEFDVAHDGLELVAVQVIGELVVVDALGAFDRLAEHLEIGIAPAAKIIAERIDAFGLRPRLVFLEEAAAGAISLGDGTQVS